MCGRFAFGTPTKEIVRAFSLTDAIDPQTRYNPTQQIAAIEPSAMRRRLEYLCSIQAGF